MTSPRSSSPPQFAVWYFVGATFVFGAPAAFLPDPAPWVRLVFLVIGFALVVIGGVQLGRELRQHRAARVAPTNPPENPTR